VSGKPRLERQICLGSLEAIAGAAGPNNKGSNDPKQTESLKYEFGAVSALFDVAERIGVREVIDKHAGKRRQGLPVGDSILLAAINRAVCPVSKNAFFADWFEQTVLPKNFPKANRKNLSSQGFWNNMSHLNGEKIRVIEDELCNKIMKEYNIPKNFLLVNNINLYNNIVFNNSSILTKKYTNKLRQETLEIQGLSIIRSKIYNIPLFYSEYSEYKNEKLKFNAKIENIINRLLHLGIDNDEITVVSDNYLYCNNIELLIKEIANKYYFIATIDKKQAIELIIENDIEYKLTIKNNNTDILMYKILCTELKVLNLSVIIYNNKELNKQIYDINKDIELCKDKLDELKEKVDKQIIPIYQNKTYNAIKSIENMINIILKTKIMKKLFNIHIYYNNDQKISFNYSIDKGMYDKIKLFNLGKYFIITDRINWSYHEILKIFNTQSNVNKHINQIKNTFFINLKPIRHFKDNKIKVHIFYCFLSLQLCSLLNLELSNLGYNLSITELLEKLKE
jgi:hypothetical protein